LALQQAKEYARTGQPVEIVHVRELHRLMFELAWPDMAGRYRTVDIDAFQPINDLPPHHSQVEQQMFILGKELETRAVPGADPGAAVSDAIWLHMELVRIHPFQEGNGKTARLAMNVVLMRDVTAPTRPVDIPVEERNRYIRCVQEARQGRQEGFEDFIADLLERMVEESEQRASLWQRLKRRAR
jgi:Fic family protein